VRVEYRGIDSSANPYLAYAVILAAGLKGIEEGYELPSETEDDVWALSEGERRAMGIGALPTSLKRAVAAMSDSDLVADTLGEDAFEYFLRNKRREYRSYDAQVTDFEISQFFPRT
jgi:glutamine synthetase, type I